MPPTKETEDPLSTFRVTAHHKSGSCIKLTAAGKKLLLAIDQEIKDLEGRKQCACIFEPIGYSYMAEHHPEASEVQRPGRCRNTANDEDGLCPGCRQERHGIAGPHPDAIHAWLKIPLQQMWDRIDQASGHSG